MLSDSNLDSESDSEEKEHTETGDLYEKIMQDPNFILSKQPRMYEEVESEEETQEVKQMIASTEQQDMSMMDQSQRNLMGEDSVRE